MADLRIDVANLEGIAAHVRRASSEFTSEPALAHHGSDVVGADVVAAALEACAAVHDRMVATLDEDATALAAHVVQTGTAITHADAGLAQAVR